MSLTSLKTFHLPQKVPELLQLMEEYGDSALILAGGSFIHGLVARGLIIGVEALIDIRGLKLNAIEIQKQGLSIGTTTRMTDLLGSDQIRNSQAFQAIADALMYPPAQIRNVATIGGNVATACSFFDLPTALLSLDAQIYIEGPNGSRNIDLQEFMLAPFENAMADNEFLTKILVPTPKENASSAFLKLETNANDLAIVNTAASLSLDEKGNCHNVRVALGGGVAGTIVRAFSAEKIMEGEKPSVELLAQASEAVVVDIDPMSDHRATAAYRKAIAKVFTARTMEIALARINNGEETI